MWGYQILMLFHSQLNYKSALYDYEDDKDTQDNKNKNIKESCMCRWPQAEAHISLRNLMVYFTEVSMVYFNCWSLLAYAKDYQDKMFPTSPLERVLHLCLVLRPERTKNDLGGWWQFQLVKASEQAYMQAWSISDLLKMRKTASWIPNYVLMKGIKTNFE